MDNCILAIDQGTTSSRAMVFSANAEVISSSQQEFPQYYPNDGWVEHDPKDIWQSTLHTCKQALQDALKQGAKVTAIGITNQRETSIVWNRETGHPIYHAIVWQDRRTAGACKRLKYNGHEALVKQKTGLLIDPYFSATKISWILDNVEGAREQAEQGLLAFGTVDSYLIWQLTGARVHATDVTNASRTSLFNIHNLQWDPELLALFNIPLSMLPDVKQCSDDFGSCDPQLLGQSIPICGVAGDQQAASIGQCCFTPGSIKSTYGTGCFVLLNTGDKALDSQHNLLTTIAYTIKGQTHYALEGSIFIAGAAIQWLRDGIQIIDNAAASEAMAKSLDHDHGVYLVPAFSGLGAPYWDPNARGAVFGLTRATSQQHLARAALESVAYQTFDLLIAMQEDGMLPGILKVDGGMVANNWVCQFLADILSVTVIRSKIMETTALGAAYLAGLQIGIFESTQSLSDKNVTDQVFTPAMDTKHKEALLKGWHKAIQCTLHFAEDV